MGAAIGQSVECLRMLHHLEHIVVIELGIVIERQIDEFVTVTLEERVIDHLHQRDALLAGPRSE